MLKIFDQEGWMVEESKKAKPIKSTTKLMFQLCVVMLASQFIIVLFMMLLGQGDLFLSDTPFGDTQQLINLFSTFAVVLGLLWFTRHRKHSYASMGLVKKNIGKQYILGLLIGFLMLATTLGLAYITGAIQFDGFLQASPMILLLYFLGFMIQGFQEELMFRGIFMNSCATKTGMRKAIIINSIWFALLHLANDGVSVMAIINLFAAGVTFSLLAVTFDNIIVCSAAHTMWNFAQGNLFGVLVSGIYFPSSWMRFSNVEGMQLLNGGAFGLEGGILVLLVNLIVIACLCYFFKQKTKKAVDK